MEQFGNELGLTKASINNFEKGRNLPNRANALLISNIAKIKPETLLSKEEPCMIQLMIESFEQMFYPLSDIMKEKLLASDPVASELKIKDLMLCALLREVEHG
jgi:transcriptional regulator with XRE-family HTH domain